MTKNLDKYQNLKYRVKSLVVLARCGLKKNHLKKRSFLSLNVESKKLKVIHSIKYERYSSTSSDDDDDDH
ncbi:CLUMA_CG021181, isoform A [Clunio marinus]|uniref:CLUMA_CG021181, isoform A n=1 Tax=Clunio marinus TaxID=568069 RepID=A0A1J1J7L6_9DIPT|nr:CLUMA_CG021181, isoform A [Clunio marinus]